MKVSGVYYPLNKKAASARLQITHFLRCVNRRKDQFHEISKILKEWNICFNFLSVILILKFSNKSKAPVFVILKVCVSHSVMSYSLRPHGLWHSRQEYWSGLSCSSPGDLPNPGIEPMSPALQADSLPSEPPGNFGVPLNNTTDSVD